MSWPCVGKWVGQDSMQQSTAVAVDHNGSMDLGDFFLPIFCWGDWLVEPKCSKWIKDVSASRKMSTDSLRDPTLDVFHMRLEFFFSKNLDKHVDGWVHRRLIRMASWKFLPLSMVCSPRRGPESEPPEDVWYFWTTYAVSSVYNTSTKYTYNIFFIHTKSFTVVFVWRCQPWYVQDFLVQKSNFLFFLNFIATPWNSTCFKVSIGAHKPSQIIQNTSSTALSFIALAQGGLSTWLRKLLWCCGMWGSQRTTSAESSVGSRLCQKQPKPCWMLDVTMWVEVKGKTSHESSFGNWEWIFMKERPFDATAGQSTDSSGT